MLASHQLLQVFVPKAQREKVDPKILVAFLTQVRAYENFEFLQRVDVTLLQHGDVLTEEQIMEVVKETDALNEVRCRCCCAARACTTLPRRSQH